MTLQELWDNPERGFLKMDDPLYKLRVRQHEARKAASKLVPAHHCERCGKKGQTEGHHESYLKEDYLNVLWLCKACHKFIHRK